MTPEEYGAFTEALRRSLEADPRVLGLVAVGSMAERETRPDAWSDHDFLVVVSPGAQEEMRNELACIRQPGRWPNRFR
jgi:hypothetical protein